MVRLKDVAARAGVSVGTASKVLSSARAAQPFSLECILRVRTAARDLGYTQNYLARSLQTGRSHAVGLALGNLGFGRLRGFYSQMVGGIMAQAHRSGYQCVTVGAQYGTSPVAQGLGFLRERRIDALILPGVACGWRLPEELVGLDTSAVLVNFHAETLLPSVELDEAVGIAAAVSHLRSLGHRRVLYFGPESEAPHASPVRREAFWAAVNAGGLHGQELCLPTEALSRLELPDGVAAGCQALLAHWIRLPRGAQGPTSIVCHDEPLAFGAYAALGELGLRVPQDVSVIGFDDIRAEVAWPPMTVVSHMLEKMGRTAAKLAISMAQGAPQASLPRRTVVPAELVVRESTGPAPVRD